MNSRLEHPPSPAEAAPRGSDVTKAHELWDGASSSYASDGDEKNSASREYKRLLVVDDDDVDRERISRYLKKFRIPVIVLDASSGSEAMRQIAKENIDLILLDYQLGDMTGTELLAQIKLGSTGTIPTIMVTGMGDERTAVEALRLGVIDYLPKRSMTADSLVSVLESALRLVDLEGRLQETQERLRRMSLYDELTGLPNRNLFFDRLSQSVLSATRNHGQFSLLMIDLNLFKEVNDSLGHAAGDQVLATIGQRLLTTSRQSDTLARIGGDEFACVLHDVHSTQDAEKCVENLIGCISQPIAIGERVIQVGASIGIARYPDHGMDVTTLLSNADSAMYAAKRSHRRYVCFSDVEAETTGSRIPIGQYLYQAICDRELYLEFQPKVDLQNLQMKGVEALARWKSPEFGQVMPGDFIPVAERSSLIKDLTYATMDIAFAQASLWRREGRDIRMSVNLSARLLDDQGLPDWVTGKLAEHGIAGRDVMFEITETALSSTSGTAQKVLAAFADAGLDVSIDDFGSGFTSFRYIRDIGFSELKIDRMFIENLRMGSRDAEIVRSMVLLAESLGMRAVAEGVETQEQLDALKRLGCHHAQGFGIARPMSAVALISWLDAFLARH